MDRFLKQDDNSACSGVSNIYFVITVYKNASRGVNAGRISFKESAARIIFFDCIVTCIREIDFPAESTAIPDGLDSPSLAKVLSDVGVNFWIRAFPKSAT